MPKYLVAASYTADGVAGLVKEGGTGRRAKVTEAIERLGGVGTYKRGSGGGQ